MSTRRILIPNQKLKLDKIINLIYFDKENLEFDEDLHEIINFLRSNPSYIKEIGYKTWNNPDKLDIRVILEVNLAKLPQSELDLLDIISY